MGVSGSETAIYHFPQSDAAANPTLNQENYPNRRPNALAFL